MVCGLISVANRIVSSIVSLRLAGQAEDEGAVDLDAQLVAVLGELAGDLDPHALLDVVQDLLVAALVADQQQPQPVVLQHLQRLARHVGLGVAGPGDAQLAEFPRDRLGARQVVGEGVVVEEEFLHLREHRLRAGGSPRRRARASARGSGARRRSAATGRRCSAICSRGRCTARRRGASGSR